MLNKIVRKHFGPDFPSLQSTAQNSSLIIVNSEELLYFPWHILHKVLYIGGVGLTKSKGLEQEWLDLVEKVEDGVVLFSFGSIANTATMPTFWKAAILKAFADFPTYTFIWKFDGILDGLETPSNVKIVHWTPQNDLLAHPKLKAFVTHSGFNSLLESAFHGKPVINIPLFADQYSNAKRAERKGISITIRKDQFNYDTLKNALKEMLINERYSVNARRLSKLIQTKPYKARDVIVEWLEYVAENKGLPELQPASVYLSYMQYLGLDVLFTILIIVCFIFAVTTFAVLKLYRYIRSKILKSKRD